MKNSSERAAVEAERREPAVRRTEVEHGAVGVVEEEAVGLAVMQSHEERDAHVHRDLGVVVAVIVGVLQRDHRPAPVEVAELLAHADEALAVLQALVRGELPALDCHAELLARQVLVEDGAVRILEADAKVGPELDVRRDGRSLQRNHGIGRGDAEGRAAWRCIGNECIADNPLRSPRRDDHANDLRRPDLDRELGRGRASGDAVRGLLVGGHGTEIGREQRDGSEAAQQQSCDDLSGANRGHFDVAPRKVIRCSVGMRSKYWCFNAPARWAANMT
jgi:hypothetical protein